MADINKMDIREFRERGFLQEANRLFFHPLGLELEVMVHKDGTEELSGIGDHRQDREGAVYGPGMISIPCIEHVLVEHTRHQRHRLALMGHIVQPPEFVLPEHS